MALQQTLRKGPKLGRKEIFLPNFTLTFLRTPSLPPTWASFIVPLNFNKFDLRDYLWNLYGVEVLTVRSFIIQAPLRRGKVGDLRATSRITRPRGEKRMMVELTKPFVWPDEPENFDAWDKKTFDAVNEQEEGDQEAIQRGARRTVVGGKRSIAQQAREILKGGEEKWKGGRKADEWINDTDEVETDVVIPKEEGKGEKVT